MTPFLKQLAEHYYAQGSSESFCFVFPNRRSLMFFKKYYAEEIKRDKKTVLAPSMLSINDFFYKVSGHSVSEHTELLLILYKCYKKLKGVTPKQYRKRYESETGAVVGKRIF